MIEIKFVKIHDKAQLPKRNNDLGPIGDTGYDVFAVEKTIIPAKGSAIVPTGIEVGYITPGYWFKVEARSGLGFKKGIKPHFGIIDQPYRGNLGIKLYNLSDKDVIIEEGQACAQIVIYPIYSANMSWINIDEVEITARGKDGFGSSDLKKS